MLFFPPTAFTVAVSSAYRLNKQHGLWRVGAAQPGSSAVEYKDMAVERHDSVDTVGEVAA